MRITWPLEKQPDPPPVDEGSPKNITVLPAPIEDVPLDPKRIMKATILALTAADLIGHTDATLLANEWLASNVQMDPLEFYIKQFRGADELETVAAKLKVGGQRIPMFDMQIDKASFGAKHPEVIASVRRYHCVIVGATCETTFTSLVLGSKNPVAAFMVADYLRKQEFGTHKPYVTPVRMTAAAFSAAIN